MKKLSIYSFLLLQFILCVASLACAQPMAGSNINANNTAVPIMLNPALGSRPQSSESITIEDVWMKSGGVRVAFLSIRTPQQVYTAGYPWLDPASTSLLQPILSYPQPKKKIVRRSISRKAYIAPTSPRPLVQIRGKQGLSLTAPTKSATLPLSGKKMRLGSDNRTGNSKKIANNNRIAAGNRIAGGSGIANGNITANSNRIAGGNRIVGGNITANSSGIAAGNITANSNRIAAGNVTANSSGIAGGNRIATSKGMVSGNVTANSSGIAAGNRIANSKGMVSGNSTANSKGMASGSRIAAGNGVASSKVTASGSGRGIGIKKGKGKEDTARKFDNLYSVPK